MSSLFIIFSGYGNPEFSFGKILRNLTIIPLNYYFIIDNAILTNPKWWLVPTAWSLAVELQIYLILPFLIFHKKLRIFAAIFSCFLFSIACFGIIHTDLFGYRLFPGILFIFIIGGFIFEVGNSKNGPGKFEKTFPGLACLFLSVILIILFVIKKASVPYVRETILGVIFGFLTIRILDRSNIKLPGNQLLGDLSYGVFLSHFLAIWVLDKYSIIIQNEHPIKYVLSVFSISLIISLLGTTIVESKIKKFRTVRDRN
ncbi:acyltransferase family protein [Leptospira ellisii]|uniref:acyltransferase family protein n=1 Tax=Leptospira ellisii TaxID=2023197 RepID=UPI000C2AC60C|nr:hypothetical protein CH375_20295 [Leptospira ellisii]